MEAYQRLEKEWADWLGLPPEGMVACSSGTAALHLAFEALQLPQGSEVLVPDFTMIACARAVAMAGLTPVFVDCGDDLLIDSGLVEVVLPPVCVGSSLGALLLVHVYGRVCSDSWINEALRHGTKIVEDLAEAHGMPPDESSDAACWSFFKNKTIHGEEGGAVWFRDPSCAELARRLRNLGFTDAHDFNHIPRGCNYRLSNANAELVLKNLVRAEDIIRVARERESRLDWVCPEEWRMPPRQAPWVYDFRFPNLSSEMQDWVVRRLNAGGVAARHGFKPMSSQPEFHACRLVGDKAAWRAAREVIYVPLTADPGVLGRIRAILADSWATEVSE